MDAFEVFFEDPNLIVLSKPAGLLSQGDVSNAPNLVDTLRARFGRQYVGLVHRLDRNTSGLMVVAKRSKAAERLSEQLQSGDLVRKYTGILMGEMKPTPIPLRLEHWLLKNEKTNEVKVVSAQTRGAKQAILFVERIKTFRHPQTGDALTHAQFSLETGRGHQIRSQIKAFGHPLIGDSKYGTGKSLTLFPRPALHSCFISFQHPISKEIMTFQQRYSADMIEFFSTELE